MTCYNNFDVYNFFPMPLKAFQESETHQSQLPASVKSRAYQDRACRVLAASTLGYCQPIGVSKPVTTGAISRRCGLDSHRRFYLDKCIETKMRLCS